LHSFFWGNHPKERIQHSKHGESLKSKVSMCCYFYAHSRHSAQLRLLPVLQDCWLKPGAGSNRRLFSTHR